MNAVVASQQTYSFHNHAIRLVLRDGEPWFVASDVAAALDYRDAANAARSLPAHQKADTRIVSTSSNGTQQARTVTVVSEGGLYRLVLRSRKPEAAAFTDWVTDEVLPSIRKTGQYATKQAAPALDEKTLYAIALLIFHFRALFEWATVNKIPQALAWLQSPLGGELRDRLLDGMGGGVKAIEQGLGEDLARVMAKFNPASTRVQNTDTHVLVDKMWLKDLKWGVVMMRRMKELMGRMRADGLPVGQMDACLSHLGGHFISGTRVILSDAGMEDDAAEVADAFGKDGGFVRPY